MKQIFFTKDHEYLSLDGNNAKVGITNYAQEQLGDVVYVELPSVGKQLAKGDEAAVVESVKAASEIYTPASGTVVSVNEELNDTPGKINENAEDDGWIFTIEISDKNELDQLMDTAEYQQLIANNS